MSSSLAQQLQTLRIQQKDQVSIPDRAKLSFIFDIKQAANIDDQTIYFLLQGGLKEIQSTLPDIVSYQLQIYQEDIFNKKSLEFYRGTETNKEVIEIIDKKIKDIIMILAPYFLETCTHKIIEFLIRIYEANVHHKHTLIYSFLPYFETSFFLRIIQVLSVQKDELFFFMHEFAYKGLAIDKKTLVRGLSRNSGILFSKYATFCYELIDMHIQQQAQPPQDSFHWKFYGTILSEILISSTKLQDSDSSSLLYTLLPFIAKGLTQKSQSSKKITYLVREVRMASLMGISQIVSRKTLSPEYAQAFIEEILNSMVDDSQDQFGVDDKNKYLEEGLTAILIIFHYQSIQILKEEDFVKLLSLKGINKAILKVSESYDVSSLFKTLAVSFIQHTSIKKEQFLPKLKEFMFQQTPFGIKCYFKIIESSIYLMLKTNENKERAQLVLDLFQGAEQNKELSDVPSYSDIYNQSLFHLLKQIADNQLKEQILEHLSKNSNSSKNNLIAQFGDKEYSLLSALGSQSRISKFNALKAICSNNFNNSINTKEKDLVKLQLQSILLNNKDDEETINLVLDAFKLYIGQKQVSNQEFDTLEEFIHQSKESELYSQQTITKAINIAVNLEVTLETREIKSFLLQLYTKTFGFVPHSFKYLVPSLGKDNQSIQKISALSFQNIALTTKLICSALQNQRSYSDYQSTINEIISQIAKLSQSKLEFINKDITVFYSEVLKSLGSLERKDRGDLILSIVDGIPSPKDYSENSQLIKKCLSNLIVLSLKHKQFDNQFDLQRVHSVILKKHMGGNVTSLAEFYIRIALESKNEVKQLFAIIALTQLAKHKLLQPQISMVSILVLLNSQNKNVREKTLLLVEVLHQQQITAKEDAAILELFQQSQSPMKVNTKSQFNKKANQDKPIFTPLKTGPYNKFLKELLKHKHELLSDHKQLQNVLNKSEIYQQSIQDTLIKCFIDLPSIKIKAHFLQILALSSKYSMLFSLALNDQFQKEYYQLKLNAEEQQENENKVRVLSEGDCQYACEIAVLICRVCSQTQESIEEHIASLTFSFLAFVMGLYESKVKLPLYFEEKVSEVLTSILFTQSTVKQLRSENKSEAIKYYLKSQGLVFSKHLRSQIKERFLKAITKQLDNKELQILINTCQSQVKNVKEVVGYDGLQQIEILLETILAIDFQNGLQLVPSVVEVLKGLSLYSDYTSSVSFCIELSIQICSNILESSSQHKAKLSKEQENGALNGVYQILTQQVERLKKAFIEEKEQVSLEVNVASKSFMMQDIDDNEQEADYDKILTNQYSYLQIVSSIFQLLNRLELIFFGNQVKSEKFLGILANFIKEQKDNQSKSTSKEQEQLNKVFRLYHQLMLKQAKLWVSGNEFSYKDNLATYIQTMLVYHTYDDLNQSNVKYCLDQLLTSLPNFKYHSMIQTLLLFHAKDKVEVKENLQLDCLELQLFEHLVTQSYSENDQGIVNHLQSLEQTIFIIAYMSLDDKQSSQARLRFDHLFKDNEHLEERKDICTWVESKIKTKKEMRRFKYIAVYFLDGLLKSNQKLQRALSYLAQEKKLKDQVYSLFNSMYLSTYVFLESLQAALQSKEYEDPAGKKSLKRLNKRVSQFQNSLNTLMSYQIQVSIALNVLESGSQSQSDLKLQNITLKIQTIQLLLNKTPQFQIDISSDKQTQLLKTYMPLIQKCLDILAKYIHQSSQKNKKLSNEEQAFIQTLFSLISKTACSNLAKPIIALELDVIFKFLGLNQPSAVEGDHKRKDINLVLHSQILLTAMTVFEVFQTEILEHLPTYFDFVMKAYERIQETSSVEFFSESYCKSVLKISLSLCTFFAKFMNADQFEQLIQRVILLSDSHQIEVSQIFDVITRESGKSTGFQILFKSIFNSFDSILLQKGIEEFTLGDNISTVSQIFFSKVLKPVIQRMKKDFCADNYKRIMKFFQSAFSLQEKYYKKNGSMDMKEIDEVEQSIVETFQQFVVKLNEEQLRPMIAKLMRWAFKVKDEKAAFPFRMHRVIIFFKMMNGLTSMLKDFFVPLISIYIDKEVELLECLVPLFQQEANGQKRKAIDQDNTKATTEGGHSYTKVMYVVCDHIKLTFANDTGSFIQNDIFERLIHPTSQMVLAIGLDTKYLSFIEGSVGPMLFEMIDRINNDDMWKKINYEVLLHSRSEVSWQIRLATFKIIEFLYNKVGERYLMLLNDTLPFISEGLEDEKNEVEMTVKSIIRRIEQLTGDSIQEYLK